MQKAMLSTKILAAATIGLSVLTFASSANATSLVPTIEGELKTNLGCLAGVTCIDPETLPFAYKVTSLDVDGDKFGQSRLFIDKNGTPNNYPLGIKFGVPDAGTNPPSDEYWFRPVAIPNEGTSFEDGQLEVGTFKFDFLGKEVASVTFDLFDVEDANTTQILKVNDFDLTPEVFAAASSNGNRQQITIYNVKSFEIKLGNPNSSQFSTGDGVAMQARVPEPATVVSLGALAVAGMFGTQKRRKMGV
jgi:hypothetical protein